MSSFTDKLFGKATSFVERLDTVINGQRQVDMTDPTKTTEVIKPNIVERIKGVPEITKTVTRNNPNMRKINAEDDVEEGSGKVERVNGELYHTPNEAKRDPVIDAIAFNETRGIVDEQKKYEERKPSGDEKMGDDIGKYQVTEAELEAWGDDILGRKVTADEFHQSPELQEEYIEKKLAMIRRDVPEITDEELLALHRGGLTGYVDPEIRKKKVEERKEYVQSGLAFRDRG